MWLPAGCCLLHARRPPPASRLQDLRLLATRSTRSTRLWSPSDLTTFAESPWVSWLERLAREEPDSAPVQEMDPPDAFLEMLGSRGADSEAAVLAALRSAASAANGGLMDLSAVRGSPEERAAATMAAIAEAPAVIYQAPLLGGGFFGVADFLVRVPCHRRPDGGSGHAYMIWDAKLARRPRPSQTLQLCCYAEMLARMQHGASADSVGLILGATPLVLRLASYDALYRRTRTRFLAAQARFDPKQPPALPGPREATGRWSTLAANELMRCDDLRLVARLTQRQAARLRAGGVGTASALAALAGAPLPPIAGVTADMVDRLSRQAALQHSARASPHSPPPFELLRGACSPAMALGSLPPPHSQDAFFDLEGFPFASLPAADDGQLVDLLALSRAVADGAADAEVGLRASTNEHAPPDGALAGSASGGTGDGSGGDGGGGGREYLWGVSTRPAAGTDVGEYLAWWAHDSEAERDAFAAAVDWITERWRTHPQMHVYHYGAYELTALRRLAGRYGTREAEVDALLRGEVLVDLYDTVRHSMLLGEPRYSIKNVERLYRSSSGGRDTAVAKGDQSVAVYAGWLDAVSRMGRSKGAPPLPWHRRAVVLLPCPTLHATWHELAFPWWRARALAFPWRGRASLLPQHGC